MSKRHILITPSTPSPKASKLLMITNWDMCILCQQVTDEALQCPAKPSKARTGTGYESLASHLIQFQELGHIPIYLDIERLNDGDGLSTTMMKHKA